MLALRGRMLVVIVGNAKEKGGFGSLFYIKKKNKIRQGIEIKQILAGRKKNRTIRKAKFEK